MKIIIVGYGRLGAALVRNLDEQGHQVIIIDADPKVFCKDPKIKNLQTVVGIGFDKDLLESAGIATVDALVACTSSDESNAVIARVAKNVYRVPKVIARLYDYRKAAIYDMLGIQTISTTDWAIQKAMKLLTYSKFESVLSIGNNAVEVIRLPIPELLINKTIGYVNYSGLQVVSVLRRNSAFIPTIETKLIKGDVVFIAATHEKLAQLQEELKG